MKRLLTMALVLGVFFVVFGFRAEAGGIAFVNLKQVLQQSQAGKFAKNQIQSLIDAKKIVIESKSKALKKLLDELNKKGISKAEKSKLKKEYEKKYKDLQMYQEQAMEEIRSKELKETNKILKLAIDTIKKYAQQHNLDGVFEVSQGNVIYWKDSLNITKEIIKLMDRNSKK